MTVVLFVAEVLTRVPFVVIPAVGVWVFGSWLAVGAP